MIYLSLGLAVAICALIISIRLIVDSENRFKEYERANKIERDAIQSILMEKVKSISKLQEMLAAQSALKVSFQERVKELEDGIKFSTGISLRREVTEVKSQFEYNELLTISRAIPYLIKEFFKSQEDLKLLMALTEKIDACMKKIADSTKVV